MKVKIEIDGSNAAFFDDSGNDQTITPYEYARILRCIADSLLSGEYLDASQKQSIRDINGNVCGYIEITEE